MECMVGTMSSVPGMPRGFVEVPELYATLGWVAHAGSSAARESSVPSVDGVEAILAGECWTDAGQSLSAAYVATGQDCIRRLEGLFSGVIVDRRSAQIVLFNDRYSVERLHVVRKGDAVLFASEAKALLSVLPEVRAWDEQGVAEFLKFGCVLNGRTLFKGLGFLPGGSIWTFERSGVREGRYFDPREWEEQPPLSAGEFERRFCDLFPARLRRYTETDHTLGISITGGLDTRMIMASLPEGLRDVTCYTYAGPSALTTDARIGAEVAQSLGFKHEVVRLGSEFSSRLPELIDRTVHATDGTAGPLHAHELALSGAAASISPVRLTGNYGSEVLRDMSTFKVQQLDPRILDPDLAVRVAAAESELQSRHPVSRAAFAEIPWLLHGTLAAARSLLTVRTPYLDNELVRLAYAAPAASRRTTDAAWNLIAGRSQPLARMATDRGSRARDGGLAGVLRRSLASVSFKLDYWDKEGLPRGLNFVRPALGVLRDAGVLGNHKYLPYRQWLQIDLRDHVRQVLSDSSIARMGVFRGSGLHDLLGDIDTDRTTALREIHTVLALDAVQRTLIRSPKIEACH